MVEQQQQAGVAIRQSVVVDAPPERAFTVFTDGMSSWWPMDGCSIGAGPMAAAVIEPREGGRWYEGAEQMRAIFGSDDGWGGLLRRFAAAAG
jgi:hypothetical protein